MPKRNSPERAAMLADRRASQRNRIPDNPIAPMSKAERKYRNMEG